MRHVDRAVVVLAGAGLALGCLLASGCAITGKGVPAPAGISGMDAIKYPTSERGTHTDVYHGVEVADPYRWMEDIESPALASWIERQNAIAEPYLAALPNRQAIRDRMESLINYERFGMPSLSGGRYFWTYNSGLMNQPVLYMSSGLDAEPTVAIDPNTFSTDGTVALGGTSVSDDGRYMAYAKQVGGSDWRAWYVRDLTTGADLPDTLEYIKFAGLSWSKDNAGFYYSRYPMEAGQSLASVNEHQKIFYHRLGDAQASDRLVYEIPEHPQRRPFAGVTEDGDYLVITISEGFNANAVHYMPLEPGSAGASEGGLVRLFDAWDARYWFIDNDGSTFYFRTDKDAPNWRVIAIDVNNPDPASWRTVVPEGPEAIDDASIVGGRLFVTSLRDARSVVRVFDKDGSMVREVQLPGIGTAGGFGGRDKDPITFYTFSGFTSPAVSYVHDVATGQSTEFKRPTVNADLSRYETKQVFYSSSDGTRVPMFIVHRKGIELDASHPTLLYGYGGFNISLTPGFSTSRVLWLEMGGVYAVANIRGGGEYGKVWHEAGTKLAKQNTFDDFIAAAEWLIDEGYTAPGKLAIQGGSNGGLLVGACITQRPDLFGCALPAVGVLDMLRYHTATVGRAWASDYGTSENPAEFSALYAYSPLHNLRQGVCYPPTLITTADRDDRVVPWHSFKFAAAMQRAQGCANPVVIRVETDAGHGSGKPISKVIDENADLYAFVAAALGMSPSFER